MPEVIFSDVYFVFYVLSVSKVKYVNEYSIFLSISEINFLFARFCDSNLPYIQGLRDVYHCKL